MQTSLMKPVGTMMLIVGVVICAASGVRLGEREFAAAIDDGRSALTAGELPVGPGQETPISAEGRLSEWSDVAGLPFALGLALLIAGA
ncbi:MAG: hypothetical protein OES38_19470, partial [Gammaproteobacteria bacterium]|nr:hypothetical protein [Gammaproteobacteria bacterium]